VIEDAEEIRRGKGASTEEDEAAKGKGCGAKGSKPQG
jgi:hypothetical protein